MNVISMALCLLLFSPKIFAEELSARQLSYAGVGGVVSSGVDGIGYNPSVLSLEADLQFGGGYGESEVSHIKARTFYGWMKDSMSSSFRTRKNRQARKSLSSPGGFPFAAALTYKDHKAKGNGFEYRKYQLAVSTVVKRRWSIGLLADYRRIEGQALNKSSFWAGSIGALYWFSKKTKLAISGRDIFETTEDGSLLSLVPKLRGSGSYEPWSFFSIYADIEQTLEGDESLSYGVGVETRAQKFLALRMSAFQNNEEDSLDYGFGVSFNGPRLQIHYGMKLSSRSSLSMHSVDFSLPLW